MASEYRILESRTLFENRMVRLVVDTLEYDGQSRPYYYLESPVESVATIGLTADQKIILTRQYRHPIRLTIYDLPAGALRPGEPILEGARREFEEETGFFPNHIEYLGYFNQFPGSLKAGTNLFFARDLTQTQQHLDPGEELEIEFFTVAEMLEKILTGEIIDGSLQLGVLLALRKGLLPDPTPTPA
jgi:ADP-ribose pyrophosphatase